MESPPDKMSSNNAASGSSSSSTPSSTSSTSLSQTRSQSSPALPGVTPTIKPKRKGSASSTSSSLVSSSSSAMSSNGSSILSPPHSSSSSSYSSSAIMSSPTVDEPAPGASHTMVTFAPSVMPPPFTATRLLQKKPMPETFDPLLQEEEATNLKKTLYQPQPITESLREANHQRWSREIDLKTTIVKLNIGGHKYTTTIKTLTQNGTTENFFTALVSNKFTPILDDEGYYFIDRDGTYFRPILDYLRTGEWIVPDNIPERLILREARFYSIEPHIYSTISDESFLERIVLKKNQFHKTQLKKHKIELKALKKHVLNSFILKIEKRETVESAVFLPAAEHVIRMWKYYTETQYHKYDAAWRTVFRRQAVSTLQQFAAKHKDDVVLDSQIYDVLYSSSSPSEPTSSFSRGVLEAFLWYFKTKHSLTVLVNDYHLLTNVRWTDDGGHLEWQLEPHIGISEPEVRGFRFVWKGGENTASYAKRKMKG